MCLIMQKFVAINQSVGYFAVFEKLRPSAILDF